MVISYYHGDKELISTRVSNKLLREAVRILLLLENIYQDLCVEYYIKIKRDVLGNNLLTSS